MLAKDKTKSQLIPGVAQIRRRGDESEIALGDAQPAAAPTGPEPVGRGREEPHRESARVITVRNRIADVFLTLPDDEMYNGVLKIILEDLGSEYGVFGYLDQSGDLIVPSMTRHIWDKCQVAGKTFTFPRGTWRDSTWPRAIREKRPVYSNEPSTNVPTGHIPIRRHICVPILHQGAGIGLLLVANRETDYDDKDVRTLQTIADYVAPILNARLYREREQKAREQAEEALRESEERFRRTFDQGPIGAAIVSLDHRFVRVNDALCRITGYSKDELHARALVDIIHPDDLATELKQSRCLLAGETGTYTMDERYVRKDGAVVWVRVWTCLMVEPAGRGLYFLSRMEDITERKRSEERARQLLEELAHVSRLHIVGEMAAAIAHELNQPLFAIMTYADVCRRVIRSQAKNAAELTLDTPRPPEADRSQSDRAAAPCAACQGLIPDLEQITAAAEQAAQIIRRLRNMVGKRPARRSTLDLNKIVQEVASLVKGAALTNHVRLHLDLAPDLPTVLADSVLTQQVIVNLARNAIEAMNTAEGGARELIIQTSVAGRDAVEVAVCDSGPGLPAEVKDRLFEPFVTTKPEGMGLGLSVSQAIIKAHGGQLLAAANPERGMTFRFTLPVSQGDQGDGA